MSAFTLLVCDEAASDPATRCPARFLAPRPDLGHARAFARRYGWTHTEAGDRCQFHSVEVEDIDLAYSNYRDGVACTGASDCSAVLHTHGCYADISGPCDDPADHATERTAP